MARIVLSGYYGFGNAGDESVLFSIIKELRRKKRSVQIVVLSNNPEQTSKAYKVEAVNRWCVTRVLGEILKADLVISGGGSLLQDTTGSKSILYYLGVVLLAKICGKPVFFYAQGMGPLKRRCSRILVRWVGNLVNSITVRDKNSLQTLRQLGVTRPPVQVTADPVLGLRVEELHRESGGKILKNIGIDVSAAERKPIAAFSVRDWKGLTAYKKALARAADDLVRKGWQIILLTLHYPEDVQACKDVSEAMEEEKYVLEGCCSAEDIMGIFTHLDLVVGVRLHALIFATVAGVPFVAVSYDSKIDAFLEEVKMKSAGNIESLEYEELSRVINEVVANREKIQARLVEIAAELNKRARKTSSLALSLIEKEDKNQ